MYISLIIPAYNEEKRIGRALAQYLEYFSQEEMEIIIVLNGCRDNTLGVVKEYQAKAPSIIKYINIKEKIGKGGGVREGFRQATGDIIGFVDADGSTSPEEFRHLIKEIDSVDGVIASRWKRESVVQNRTWLRKIISLGFVLLVKIVFWLPFSDTQCGAKIFKNHLIKKILPFLTVNNMAFDVEILYLARRYGFKIKEIPTVWIDQSSSAFLGSPLKIISSSLEMFSTLVTLRFKFLFKK